MSQLFGKYRGVVTGNEDDQKRGQIQFSLVQMLGDYREHWAMPCVPYAGNGVGLYAIPPVGAGVWIEFEAGDINRPIWSGCYWLEDEAPVEEGNADEKVLVTERGRIVISDADDAPGITLITKDSNGNDKMKIVVNNDGIEIDNGQGASIKLSNGKVSINGTALEVE